MSLPALAAALFASAALAQQPQPAEPAPATPAPPPASSAATPSAPAPAQTPAAPAASPAAAAASPAPAEAEKAAWYDPLVLDAYVGALTLREGDFRFAGDATLGYATPNLGLVMYGFLKSYDLQPADVISQTDHRGGKGEAWYATGSHRSPARFEVRIAGGGDYYDTNFIPATAQARARTNLILSDETSWMGHGSVLLGGHLNAGNTLRAMLLIGGGFQYESYNYLTLSNTKSNQITDTDEYSARQEARLQVRWSFLPEILSARLLSTASHFSMTRNADFLTTAGGAAAVTSQRTTFSQLEARGRLSLELDVLAWLGISPFAFGGIDYYRQASDAGTTATTVPNFGVGLFKPMD